MFYLWLLSNDLSSLCMCMYVCVCLCVPDTNTISYRSTEMEGKRYKIGHSDTLPGRDDTDV